MAQNNTDIRFEAIQLYVNGMPAKQIAYKLGANYSNVKYWIKRHRATCDRDLLPYMHTRMIPRGLAEALEEARTSGESLRQIASRHGLNYHNFYHAVKKSFPEVNRERQQRKQNLKQKNRP